MEIDASVMNSLPLAQRTRLINQLRKEQVRRYNEWLARNPDLKKVKRQSTASHKGGVVRFDKSLVLCDAATCFDDRQVLMLLEEGISSDVSNAAGITLLHRCCIADNLSVAELLINHGANVNVQDGDLWTPLHCACECDNADIAALLLANGADPLLLDVDDNLPVDHAPLGSTTRDILEQHLEEQGVLATHLATLRKAPARRMLADVKDLIETPGGDVSLPNEAGITLLHIACVNGYKEVAKQLIAHSADLNAADNEGLTPLHVAAKFNQIKMVKLLIKHLADPSITDDLGHKPADLTGSEEIVGILEEYERTRPPDVVPGAPVIEIEEGIYDFELEAPKVPSKSVSPHETLSKTDALLEARLRMEELRGVLKADDTDDVYDYVDMSGRGPLKVKKECQERAVVLPDTLPNDDLTSLPEISDSIITEELRKRYMHNRIYTYIGDILVTVNPFRPMAIHHRSVSSKYKAAKERRHLSPHIFGMAEATYRQMKVERQSQCCVISGESGAGKTESAKYLIQHLLTVAISEETNLNARIEKVNILLEAFGNARTVINDNSSRFGKYLELMFSDDGIVQGAKIHEYLLEKSRVVYQEENETNFHIFYLMFAGFSPDEKAKYQLGSAKKHRYLSSLGDKIDELLGSQSLERLTELRDCLTFIGFSSADIDNLFISLSAVLHLGDVTFKPVGNNDSARLANKDTMDLVSSLLQVPSDELGSCLEAEITVTRGEYIRKERSVSQASDCRDALAKSLYARLFSWIVNSINQLIQPLEGSEPSVEIGILDIFGFENFPKNSFEQICINLANEQLQFHFNKHIFELELQDCAEEGVSTDMVRFTNNADIIELFLSKPQGILAILDEQSRFPKATDQSLATKLHAGPGKVHPTRYKVPKDKGTTFTIVHYAGYVTYNLDGVLEKNRETLPTSILFTMKTSNSLVIKEMFRSRLTRTGSLAPSTRQRRSRSGLKAGAFDFFLRRKSKEDAKPRRKGGPRVVGSERAGPSTAAFHFKNSLADLMSKMAASSPHFIRCLKPNRQKAPESFDPEYVCAQLGHTGVLHTVRIRKGGFPLRLSFEDFLTRYEVLSTFYVPSTSKEKDAKKCQQILAHCQIQDYKVGKTKLFFRSGHPERLAQLTTGLQTKVVTVQTVIRGLMAQKSLERLRTLASEREAQVKGFLGVIDARGATVERRMRKGQEHDTDRQNKALQRAEEEKKRKEEEEEERKRKEEEEKKRKEEEEEERRKKEEEQRREAEEKKKKEKESEGKWSEFLDEDFKGRPNRQSMGLRR